MHGLIQKRDAFFLTQDISKQKYLTGINNYLEMYSREVQHFGNPKNVAVPQALLSYHRKSCSSRRTSECICDKMIVSSSVSEESWYQLFITILRVVRRRFRSSSYCLFLLSYINLSIRENKYRTMAIIVELTSK